jgi:hypothetical protein
LQDMSHNLGNSPVVNVVVLHDLSYLSGWSEVRKASHYLARVLFAKKIGVWFKQGGRQHSRNSSVVGRHSTTHS